MASPRHRITIARDQFKFSCAHMTVFPDGTKERLHGHNYTLAVALDLADVSFAAMVPFAVIKDALAALCADWRERTMLATGNPFFELIRDDGDELEARLCGRRYVLPREDVALLPVDNVSVEALAAHAAELLRGRLAPVLGAAATGLEVTISENPGQGASTWLPLG